MKYFRNSEITKLYNVSDKAVRNWIQAAQQNKIELDLHEQNSRVYIADTLRNNEVMAKLVGQGRKYRNKRSHRKLTPSPEFYKSFNPPQIIDIINGLDIRREAPPEYKYFGEGAKYWNNYLYKLFNAGSGNLLTNTIETLKINFTYLDSLLSPYNHVNVVNLCVGNCLAVKDLLAHIKDQGKLKRFAAVDISMDMLDISEHNIQEWFQGELGVEKYIRDISHQRFDDVLTKDSYGMDASDTINLILLLAGPIVNFKEPDQALRTIRDSMNKNDLLITTLKRDTEQTRRFFDFNIDADKNLLNAHDRNLFELLNIESSFYELEQAFDEAKRLRFIRVRLKLDLSLQFKVGDFQKIVELKKGENVLLWRSWHHRDQDIIDRFLKTDFSLQQVSRSLDDQLIMLITKLKASDK